MSNMAYNEDIRDNEPETDEAEDSVPKQNKYLSSDLQDSPEDEAKMQTETVVLDLPDVSDIPGQENIVVPVIGEMADTTISSDDEEGLGLFDDDDADEDTDLIMGNEADVTPTERSVLSKAGEDMPDEDDPLLRSAELDNTDDQGDELNEGSLSTDVSGRDLDVPGADDDDAMEDIGEEDEENNDYSLGGDSNNNLTEETP